MNHVWPSTYDQVEEFFIELVGVNFSPVTLVKDMNPPTVMKTTTPKVETFQHAFPVISIFSQAPGRGAGLAEASRLWGPFDIER